MRVLKTGASRRSFVAASLASGLGLLPFDARYPRLATWMQRVERVPGYEKTYPPQRR